MVLKMKKEIELIAEGVALWTIYFVDMNLIFRPELEPVFLIKFVEVIACGIAFFILVNKLWKEILEYAKHNK